MLKLFFIFTVMTLAAPQPLAARDLPNKGQVAEIIVKIITPDGPKWFKLGAGVEAVDVTEGKVVRFDYQGDSIEAIEVLPDGTPVEDKPAN